MADDKSVEFDESDLPPEIAAIDSAEKLEEYLKDKPIEWSRIIAWRAAMRVFPFAMATQSRSFPRQFDQLTLQSFRALLISSAVRKIPANDIIRFAATAAEYTAAVVAAANANAAAGNAPEYTVAATAANAAAYTANAAAAANANAAANAAAAGANVAANVAAAAAAAMWPCVRFDLNQLRMDQDIENIPLWDVPSGANTPSTFLVGIQNFKSGMAENSPWYLIATWYEALLPSNPDTNPRSVFDTDKLKLLATQSRDFWGDIQDDDDEWVNDLEFDPHKVMQRIADLVGYPEKFKDDEIKVDTAEVSVKTGDVGLNTSQGKENASTSPQIEQQNTDLISDRPEDEFDYLDRAPLALALAGKLNIIWEKYNGKDEAKGSKFNSAKWTGHKPIDWDDGRLDNGFVVHLDAPWGGGKTTFVQYLTRILNPYRDADKPPEWLQELDMENNWNEKYRIPWHIVEFDAWQHQHVKPPWWVFWQAIYKQTMRSVRKETNQRDDKYPKPTDKFSYIDWLGRHLKWLSIWAGDLKWRIFAPGMKAKIAFFVGVVLLWWFLTSNGLLQIDGDKVSAGANVSQGMGGLIAAVITLVASVIPVIWGVSKVWGDTLLPGTPSSADNYQMGAGDPLDNFRKHFAKTMRKLGRPVIVVVDNLDRCHAEYVVNLIQGMQTVLVSPRVVFVLLGDRDWIEQSFTDQYKAMKNIEVGQEHEFGARFVEKAIQLSFILPRISQASKDEFIKKVLGGDGLGPAKPQELDPVQTEMNEKFSKILEGRTFADRENLSKEFRAELSEQDISEEEQERYTRELNRKLAAKAATDRTTEVVTKHALQAVSKLMPPNPRQVIRIINSIVLIQEMARIQRDISPGGKEWQLLVRWIILMTEWPKSWFTLSHRQNLADKVIKDTHKRDKYGIVLDKNPDVIEILRFENATEEWKDNPIDIEAVEWLVKVMPPTSGKMLDPGQPEAETPASGKD